MLRSPPRRRVASAPWGPSTAAEQSSAQQEREREKREERQAKTGICCYWFQQHGWSKNLGLESRSGTSPLLSVYPNRWRVLERMGEGQRRGTEQEIGRGLSVFFFFTWHQADSSTISVPFVSCMTFNFFFPSSLYHTMFNIILQLLLCPYLQCLWG